jgi:SAM-dependent methyltransferase
MTFFCEKKRFKRIEKSRPQNHFLKEYVAQKLYERLFFHKKTPQHILEISERDVFFQTLCHTIPIHSFDDVLTPDALFKHRLKEKKNSYDACISNLSLHTINDLPGFLSVIHKSLEPDSFFMGSFYAYGSLENVTQSFYRIEEETTHGVAQRFFPLLKPNDCLNLLKRVGFYDCLVDVEDITITYQTLKKALDDLMLMGERNCLARAYPMCRKTWTCFDSFMNQAFSQSALEVTVRVGYFYGVKKSPVHTTRLKANSFNELIS